MDLTSAIPYVEPIYWSLVSAFIKVLPAALVVKVLIALYFESGDVKAYKRIFFEMFTFLAAAHLFPVIMNIVIETFANFSESEKAYDNLGKAKGAVATTILSYSWLSVFVSQVVKIFTFIIMFILYAFFPVVAFASTMFSYMSFLRLYILLTFFVVSLVIVTQAFNDAALLLAQDKDSQFVEIVVLMVFDVLKLIVQAAFIFSVIKQGAAKVKMAAAAARSTIRGLKLGPQTARSAFSAGGSGFNFYRNVRDKNVNYDGMKRHYGSKFYENVRDKFDKATLGRDRYERVKRERAKEDQYKKKGPFNYRVDPDVNPRKDQKSKNKSKSQNKKASYSEERDYEDILKNNPEYQRYSQYRSSPNQSKGVSSEPKSFVLKGESDKKEKKKNPSNNEVRGNLDRIEGKIDSLTKNVKKKEQGGSKVSEVKTQKTKKKNNNNFKEKLKNINAPGKVISKTENLAQSVSRQRAPHKSSSLQNKKVDNQRLNEVVKKKFEPIEKKGERNDFSKKPNV